MADLDSTPARQLEGRALDGGWIVGPLLERQPNATGGHFSAGYVVSKGNGERGFLKALDYSEALASVEPAEALLWLTQAFTFERNLLQHCRGRGFDRVVTAITAGRIRVSDAADGVVEYLIFELADGDLRVVADASHQFDLAWVLRSLHHVATGVSQLHSAGIAHQDLKPSNVLVFDMQVSKIADLGRAAQKGQVAPYEAFVIAGDPAYAPPELLYGFTDPDWSRRRQACDVYLLGSMAVFCLTGQALTPLLVSEIDSEHRPDTWAGPYSDVLPYVRDAFGRVMEVLEPQLPAEVSAEVVEVIRQLCDPDPGLRGHPSTRTTTQFSLERYVSLFDRLARRAESNLRRRL